jgi:dihydroxy-acid dehydratase
LGGNLAGDGAIIKQSASTEKLLVHSGRAVVFDSLEDLSRRIDDEELDVHEDDVLIMRNAGPRGAPGMPEAGYIPIPKKLARQGVTDMVRISDARMSGTAFGTIVLHATPEAAIGGPLALVRDGDLITLNVPERRLSMEVSDEELEHRRKQLELAGDAVGIRGYRRLFHEQVNQAGQGCDFAFLASLETTRKTP